MNWGAFGISALEGGLNAISQGVTAAINAKSQRETNELNYQMFQEQQDFLKSEAELAFHREKEMWNMQNEYNSPAQQMKRYQEAGLNPNLIYGQGTPGNAQSAPSYSPAQSASRPEMKASKIQAPSINILSQYAQLSQLKENTELINMQKQVYEQDVEAKRIQNRYADTKEQLSLDMTAIQMAKEKGIITETEARTEYQRIQNKIAQLDYDFNLQTFDDRVAQVKANLNLSEQNAKIVVKNLELLDIDKLIKNQIIQEYKDKHELHSATDLAKLRKVLSEELDERSKEALLNIANIESEKAMHDIINMNNDQTKFFWEVFKFAIEAGQRYRRRR